jgi:hypothetical protein
VSSSFFIAAVLLPARSPHGAIDLPEEAVTGTELADAAVFVLRCHEPILCLDVTPNIITDENKII